MKTGEAALVGGGSLLLLNSGLFGDLTSGEIPQTGYQGGIPEYAAAQRQTVPSTLMTRTDGPEVVGSGTLRKRSINVPKAGYRTSEDACVCRRTSST